MKKGAKIAIAIITPVVLASTIVGTVLGIKNSKENTTPANPDSSVTTPAQPDQPNIPNVPEQPVQPDQPNTPDQPIVEKTEQEYMQECKNKLTSKVTAALQAKYKLAEISNVKLVKMNSLNGTAYFTGIHTQSGLARKYLYTIETSLGNIVDTKYKKLSDDLNDFEIANIDRKNCINGAWNSYDLTPSYEHSVSEELYNQLCEYVLGKVGLDDAEVLNATEFHYVSGGMMGTILTVLKDNKIYTIEANAHSGGAGNQEEHIDRMLSSSTNEIKIVSEEDFKEFFTE